MARYTLAAFLVLASTAVHAQDRLTPAAPYLVMVAGNVADLWTTQSAIGRGALETNPVLAGSSRATLALAKVGGTVAFAVVMRALEAHGHPTIAKWFGYVDGAAMFAVAAHNARVQR